MRDRGEKRSRVSTTAAVALVFLMILAGATVAFASARVNAPASAANATGAGSGPDPSYVVIGPPAPAILGDSSPEPSHAFFGGSVAVSGSLVAVGAPFTDSDTGQVFVFNTANGSVLSLLDPAPGYTYYSFFGLSIALSGTTLVVGAPGDSNPAGQMSAGHAYVFNAANGSLIQQLRDPNSQPDGSFGTSVAISGNTIVVGAPGETDDDVVESGAAYVYGIPGGLTNILLSPNPGAYDDFGASVAISGNQVVVGAPNQAVGLATYAGEAYVFDAASGHVVRSLIAPTPQNFASFGGSVAIAGAQILVGAPLATSVVPGGIYAGEAYLINDVSGAATTLISPNPQDGGNFGDSVALSGTTAVVGAGNESTSGVNNISSAGAAYAFSTNSLEAFSKRMVSPSPTVNGDFGAAVAIAGSTIVIGAPYSGMDSAGLAFIFRAPATVLSSPEPQAGAQFGTAVAASGSLVVVGAPGANGANGTATIFNKATGSSILLQPQLGEDSYFGLSVAISGTTVVIGAPGFAYGEGIAMVYNALTGALEVELTSLNPQLGGWFGASVAISGSIALVGAPYETQAGGGPDAAGNVYEYDLATHTVPNTFSSPNAQYYGEFGYAVALNGSTAVIGAPYENTYLDSTVTLETGNAYLVDISTQKFTTLGTTQYPSPNLETDGEFGYSVAIDASEAIVGAPNQTSSSLSHAGNAYLFSASGRDVGAWVGNLTSASPEYFGEFGLSVAINGITALVGAPFEDSFSAGVGTVNGSSGNAYFFNLNSGIPADVYSSPYAAVNGELGFSVALTSSYAVVGAPGEYGFQSGGYATGHAYIT